MKKLLVLFAAMMLTASCACAQSEVPKLMLSQITGDNGVITEDMEGETFYKAEGLDAIYDDFGYLDWYEYTHDCGCTVVYDGYGYTDEPMGKGTCGKRHIAPVMHEYIYKQPDADMLAMLKDLTGKDYTLEYLKTQATLGEFEIDSDGNATLEDKNYDAVGLYKSEKPDIRYFAEKNQGGKWTAKLPEGTSGEEVGIFVKQGDKLTYFDAVKQCERIALGWFFEYDYEGKAFQLSDTYQYGASAAYDADGKMTSYWYEPRFMSGDMIWRYSRAEYDTKNRLISLIFDDMERDRWTYQNGKWYFCDYDDETETEVEIIPSPQLLAAIPQPLKDAIFEAEIVTDAAQRKESGVPFVIADEETAYKLNQDNVGVAVTVHPVQDSLICYELDWLQKSRSAVHTDYEVDLVLAWPHGLNLEWAKTREFVVEHTKDSGEVELLSTINHTAVRTEEGLRMHVTSFSPFEMNWGSKKEMQQIIDGYNGAAADLPSTGDNSHLFLWAGLLMISLCAYGAGRKVRA